MPGLEAFQALNGGGECVHLGRFYSDEVMVVFLIAECASKTHSKFKSTMDRNCYDWLKKYVVSKVVARENGGCARQRALLTGTTSKMAGTTSDTTTNRCICI